MTVDNLLLKFAAIRGIPNRREFGNVDKLTPGLLVDAVIQAHKSKHAGPHYDWRMGTPELGLFSAATKESPPKPGGRITVHQTQIHSYPYKDYEGPIGRGYGEGTVKKHDEGKALITQNTENAIHFSTVHGQQPNRYVLVKPKEGSKSWLLIRAHTPSKISVPKPKFELIAEKDIEDTLKRVNAEDYVQAKIDGALNLIQLGHKAEVMSYRDSKKHPDTNILHTEKFWKGDPSVKLPPEYRDTTLMAEIFGVRNKKAIPAAELSGLLNSNIADSISKQKAFDTDLRASVFDVAKVKGTDVSNQPYKDRFELLKKIVSHLPQDKFTVAETVHGPEATAKLLAKIRAGEHPLTGEGIVIRKADGHDQKVKLREDYDVFIRNIFKGENKYKDSAGGFDYSMQPKGPIVGRVGQGFDDETRRNLWQNKDEFEGRAATVLAQGKYDSGALRVPIYQNLHEAK